MQPFRYANAPFSIPAYKTDAHRAAWDYLAAPGSWWSGAARIAIARTSRAAADCALCRDRKAALTPLAVNGIHTGATPLLDAVATDAIHRITTDPARLTQAFVADLHERGLDHGRYVEMVSIIVTLISIDTFHRALGLALEPLPEPIAGESDGYLPPGASIDVGWVPMIFPENLTETEADIYCGAPRTGHVIRAMSLVPDAVRQLNALSSAHYLPTPEVSNMESAGALTLTRPQTELVAARTSILNDCFY